MPLTAAVMQPYFIPYAGYFRLIAQSDVFVVFDCVQFPRRGWVHRNRLRNGSGELQWLTLPLAYAPQNVRIADLQFAPDAAEIMADRIRPFNLVEDGVRPFAERMTRPEGSPCDFIVDLLAEACRRVGLGFAPLRSSSLGLPDDLRGQERILAILERVGADRYLNAPGGRDLYDAESFAAHNVTLDFLPPWEGSYDSILEEMRRGDPSRLAPVLRAATYG